MTLIKTNPFYPHCSPDFTCDSNVDLSLINDTIESTNHKTHSGWEGLNKHGQRVSNPSGLAGGGGIAFPIELPLVGFVADVSDVVRNNSQTDSNIFNYFTNAVVTYFPCEVPSFPCFYQLIAKFRFFDFIDPNHLPGSPLIQFDLETTNGKQTLLQAFLDESKFSGTPSADLVFSTLTAGGASRGSEINRIIQTGVIDSSIQNVNRSTIEDGFVRVRHVYDTHGYFNWTLRDAREDPTTIDPVTGQEFAYTGVISFSLHYFLDAADKKVF